MTSIEQPTHSAIVVRAPAVEALVHELRDELDPSAAWGVPAHVTVLYPFAPPAQITIETLSSLRNATQSEQVKQRGPRCQDHDRGSRRGTYYAKLQPCCNVD